MERVKRHIYGVTTTSSVNKNINSLALERHRKYIPRRSLWHGTNFGFALCCSVLLSWQVQERLQNAVSPGRLTAWEMDNWPSPHIHFPPALRIKPKLKRVNEFCTIPLSPDNQLFYLDCVQNPLAQKSQTVSMTLCLCQTERRRAHL